MEPRISVLERFQESCYLHQTVGRRADGRLLRFDDLDQAIAEDPDGVEEWRVHFHVPVYIEKTGECDSTRFFLEEILPLLPVGSASGSGNLYLDNSSGGAEKRHRHRLPDYGDRLGDKKYGEKIMKDTAVKAMFETIAPSYDFQNSFLSLRRDIYWRQVLADSSAARCRVGWSSMSPSAPRRWLWPSAKRYPLVRVVGVDFSPGNARRSATKKIADSRGRLPR